MENFVKIIFAAFVFVFAIVPSAIILTDRCSDRFHAWLQRRIRKARRDLAAWLLAPDGLTVCPMNETETSLAPKEVSVEELVDMIRRWSA